MKTTPTAAYIRVSTQEQALHGYSLDAQRSALNEYAEKNNLIIVKWYEDEGVSGRKLIKNRPALQQMIVDAEGGLFQHIIFIKLDRFFRSVAEYHECMKRLGSVTWDATEEKYDLTTATGRLLINSKLMIAEYEADNTGDRIKIVNRDKVRKGQPISGAQPFGFKIVNTPDGKRVVHDEEKSDALRGLLAHFMKHNNKRQAVFWLEENHGVYMELKTLNKLLSNTMLYGAYRDNPNYCEPYITKEEFDEIQKALPRSYKNNTSYPYIFRGLLVCPECGRALGGTRMSYGRAGGGRKIIRSYRCPAHAKRACPYTNHINESKLEQNLLEALEPMVIAKNREWTIKARTLKKANPKPLENELSNLNYMFQKGRITVEQYDAQYEAISAKLKALQEVPQSHIKRDYTELIQLINSDWKTRYRALDNAHKRLFWRGIIERVEVGKGAEITNIFFK